MHERSYSRDNADAPTRCEGCGGPIGKGQRVILSGGREFCGSNCRIYYNAQLDASGGKRKVERVAKVEQAPAGGVA